MFLSDTDCTVRSGQVCRAASGVSGSERKSYLHMAPVIIITIRTVLS